MWEVRNSWERRCLIVDVSKVNDAANTLFGATLLFGTGAVVFANQPMRLELNLSFPLTGHMRSAHAQVSAFEFSAGINHKFDSFSHA